MNRALLPETTLVVWLGNGKGQLIPKQINMMASNMLMGITDVPAYRHSTLAMKDRTRYSSPDAGGLGCVTISNKMPLPAESDRSASTSSHSSCVQLCGAGLCRYSPAVPCPVFCEQLANLRWSSCRLRLQFFDKVQSCACLEYKV